MNVLMPVFLERLRSDHARFSKVLTVLKEQIGAVQRDQEPWAGWLEHLAALFEYIGEYPDMEHHPMEDRLFDCLVDHGLTPAERGLVERNLAEHAELTAATRRLSEEIQDLLSGTEVHEATLREDVLAYLSMQLAHMRREEEHLFPLAEKMLTSADWQALESKSRHLEDPMFHQRQARYQNLYQFVTAAD